MKELLSWIRAILTAVVLSVLITVFLVQPTKVSGHSMDPTLHDKQRIFISKLMHTFHNAPEYGDIVILDSRIDRERTWKDDFLEDSILNLLSKPTNDHTIWVKRVIGKPGDTIEFKNNHVVRNGKQLVEPYIKEEMMYSSDEKIKIPAGHVFVMGDNRNNSNDSRFIGSIPINHLLGKKIF